MNNETFELQEKGWTKRDFFSPDGEPYKWLYSTESDPFRFEACKQALEEYALSLGIKGPGKLIQAYKVARSGIRPADHYTNFPDQGQLKSASSEYCCGQYTCETGITREGRMGEVIVVCTHPILPIERLIDVDTNEVKIRIAYCRSAGDWQTAIFDKATLSNARSITQLAACGISVTSESAKELVRYLAYMEDINYAKLPKTMMTNRLGWVENYGFSPYVKDLVYDSNGQFQNEYKSVRQGGDCEEWLKLTRSIRKSNVIGTRIVLAASFASVLVKQLDALPFIVHLWGSVSGIGKSVALVLAASVWAYPEIGYYAKTTKATDVALEQMAFFAGNMPLCLDELQLIQTKKNFDEIVYALCEGTGKSRGAKTGGLQSVRRWCNSIITTGEMPITSGNSKMGAVNRVLEVECSDKLFDNPREAYQTLIKHYGHAGRRFVEALQSNKDYFDVAKDAQQRYYEQLQGEATDKQVLAGSILLAADFLAEMIIFQDGVTLTADEIKPFLTTKESADTNRRAYGWLCDWIASNPNKFTPTASDIYPGECWGCFERDEQGVAVRCCIIKSIFDRVMQDNGFNPASFLSWAAKAGKVLRDNGHLTKLKRIGNSAPARCVFLVLPSEEEEENAVTVGGEEDYEQIECDLPF